MTSIRLLHGQSSPQTLRLGEKWASSGCGASVDWFWVTLGHKSLGCSMFIPLTPNGWCMICAAFIHNQLFLRRKAGKVFWEQMTNAPALRLPGIIMYSKVHCIGQCPFYMVFFNVLVFLKMWSYHLLIMGRADIFETCPSLRRINLTKCVAF